MESEGLQLQDSLHGRLPPRCACERPAATQNTQLEAVFLCASLLTHQDIAQLQSALPCSESLDTALLNKSSTLLSVQVTQNARHGDVEQKSAAVKRTETGGRCYLSSRNAGKAHPSDLSCDIEVHCMRC